MIWNSFAEFAAMGGYGLYVWGSVTVVAASLAAELTLLTLRGRSAVAAARAAGRHASGYAAGHRGRASQPAPDGSQP